jgi:hypothetical protein
MLNSMKICLVETEFLHEFDDHESVPRDTTMKIANKMHYID